MKVTLKTKTALLTVVLVVVLLGAAGWWQREELGREYVSLLQKEQESLARAIAADLDDKIALHLNQLARSTLALDERTFTDAAAQQHFFERLAGARPLFDGLALILPDGRVVANDPPAPAGSPGVQVGDRDYFQRAVATGKPAMSSPLMTRTTQHPAVLMAAPVHDAQGRLIGVLGAGVSLLQSSLLGSIQRVPVGEAGYLVIVTQAERPVYVLHPDRSRLLQPVDAHHSPRDVQQARVLIDPLARTRGSAIVTRAPIPSAGWELRVVLPAEEAFAPLLRAQDRMLRELGLLALVLGALVWIGSQWLLRPLGLLHRAVRLLRDNPAAEVHLPTGASDEIGDLTREFDALIHEVRAHQAELAAVSDASPLGLFRCVPDGRLTYVNQTYLRIHGMDRVDAAQGWAALIPPERREAAVAAWQAAVQRSDPISAVYRIVRADGSSALLSVRTAPVIFEGRLVAHAGTVEDITERAAAEKAQRMLTAVFDATTDYVVQHDTAGRMVYMNPAARQRSGIAADAPITHLVGIDFHPPSMHQRLVEEIVPTALARGVWLGESVVYDAQRREFPVSHMVIAHRDKNGRVEQFSGILRDISAEKAARQALSQSEATLRSVAEALPAIIAVVDRDQRFRFTNSAFERWYGTRREEVVGRTVREVLGPVEYERSRRHVEAALGGERQVHERDYPGRDRPRHLELTYIPLRAADGTVDGYVGVGQDVSERKAEELRLRELTQIDPLTGLLNRAGFESRMHEATLRARETGHRLALLYLDLDRFKPVNDRHGHTVGDKLLKVFARRVKNALRPGDTVARLGGDEFAVVLENLPQRDDAQRVALKLLDAAALPFQIDGLRLEVGISVGVAFLHPDDLGWQTLVERADRMMYSAKQAGRNRHAVASDDQDSALAPLA